MASHAGGWPLIEGKIGAKIYVSCWAMYLVQATLSIWEAWQATSLVIDMPTKILPETVGLRMVVKLWQMVSGN